MTTPPNPEEAIVDAALEMPAHERAAYLDKVCGNDPQLRQLVEALLHAHKKIISSQINPPRDPSAALTQSDSVPPLAEEAPERQAPAATTLPVSVLPIEKPGDHIGRYKLLEQIGEGGFGMVYVAEQREPVKRRVALKIVKLGMDTRQVVGRFEAERQALALMDHPNIAKVFDGGATEAGRPYFVMELVRGIKITDYCDQNNLPTIERLELFVQICRAIQHAHQKGIIHRDIKPSNILVTLHDGVPVPKVIDFGIAKATQQELTRKTIYTQLQEFIGTPAYMSPEQAEMSGLDIDTRSDIYSLGVLLYELLTGETPFDGRKLVGAGLDEIRRIIREQEPPRPSTCISALTAEEQTTVAKRRQVELPKLVSQIRGDLDWIVMKCLEKDRTRRYDTANGLASDIQRYLNNDPIVARPPSNLYRFQKLVRRNKLAFAAAGALAMMLLLGVFGSTWQAIRAMRAEREQSRLRESAQQAQANEAKLRLEAETEAARSKQVAQFMKDMLKGVGPGVALGRNTDLLREILDKTAKRVGKDLDTQPVVEAELCETLGVVYRDLGQYTNAEAMLLESFRLRKQLDGEESVAVASALHNLAEVFRLQFRNTEAEAGFREALRIRRKFLGNEHPDVAASLYGLAEVLRRGSGPAQADAESAHREALAIRQKLPGRELETASSLTGLGVLLKNQPGKLEEAETCLRQAAEIQRPRLGEHPDLAYTLSNLGYVLRQVPGKQTKAEALLREALAMQEKILGDHRDTAMTLHFLAGTVTNREEAVSLHREALGMRRKVLGETHPDVTASLTALEDLLMQGDQGGDKSSLRVTRALNSLAASLYAQGKKAEAETTAREAAQKSHAALAQYEKLAGDPAHLRECWRFATSYEALVRLLHDLGHTQEAELACRDTLLLWRLMVTNSDTEDHRFHLAVSYDMLGTLLRETGRATESLEAYRAAQTLWQKLVAQFNMEDRRTHLGQTEDDISQLLKAAGQFAEAAEVSRQALAVWRKLVSDFSKGDYRDHLCRTFVNLAEVLQTQGKSAEARSLYREIGENGSAPELNELAWLLATSANSAGRDGTNAVIFAEGAVAGTSRTNAGYLDTLAAAYAEAGEFTNAVAVQQEAISLLKTENEQQNYASRLKLYEANSPYRDDRALAELASAKLKEGKFSEAESLARECLALREKQIPDDWHTFNARAMLGGALLGQKKYAEAEPLLLAGYNGLKQREARISAAGKPHLEEALQRLLQLYEATDRPEQAAEWKQKLEEFEHAEARKPAS